MPGAVGSAPASGPADRGAGWYLRRYPGDPVVGTAFRSVLGLCAPVTSLFAPSAARAVLLRPPMPTPAEPPTSPEEPGA
ncbi:hypothetical protein GCM10010420_39770 [Streptomyces glaucosporus]|uniref:Uncharacterized protein n=1 Tax=Streptomyces glaucosporus TaxID=284044 RepID=A0ABP5VPG5_9ACTN